MTNYGEVLAYWYLRLNGFFPLTDFVLHRTGGELHSSDCDVLAVRFPFVSEEIGGRALDWDTNLFQRLNDDGTCIVGLVVQVKTGTFSANALKRAFSQPRLTKAIYRTGIFPRSEVSRLAQNLKDRASIKVDRGEKQVILGKLAVLADMNGRREEARYLVKSLDNIKEFIRDRMRRYADPKNADRMFFPDPLIQYFASETGTNEYSDLLQIRRQHPVQK